MSSGSESGIIRRELDPDAGSPAIQVVWAVADIEDEDPLGLPPIYDRAGGMLDGLFSDPPSSKAQGEITFSYEGFRITVDQDGMAKFVTTE